MKTIKIQNKLQRRKKLDKDNIEMRICFLLGLELAKDINIERDSLINSVQEKLQATDEHKETIDKIINELGVYDHEI